MFISDICLLCHVKTQNVKSVTSIDEDGVVIEQKIKNVLATQEDLTSFNSVVNFKPETPKKVCKNCLKSVNTYCGFRNQCQKNIQSLSAYINKVVANSKRVILPGTLSQLKNQQNNVEMSVINDLEAIDGQAMSLDEKPISLEDTEMPRVCAENLKPVSEVLKDAQSENLLTEVDMHDPIAVSESFNDIDTLKQTEHITEAINDLKNSKCNVCNRSPMGENMYKCGACNRSFEQIKTLINHVRTHSSEKLYQCKICERGFNRKDGLMVHLERHRRHLTGERPFECNICQKRFIQQENLNKHKKLHGVERPFDCKTCNKKFRSKKSLSIHRRMHDQSRPYKCSVCEWSFNQKEHLNAHMVTHTGERPFNCDQCPYSAALKTSLRSHMRRIHKIETGGQIRMDAMEEEEEDGGGVGGVWVEGEGVGVNSEDEGEKNNIDNKIDEINKIDTRVYNVLAETNGGGGDVGGVEGVWLERTEVVVGVKTEVGEVDIKDTMLGFS